MPYANAEARKEYMRTYRKKQRQALSDCEFETFLNRARDDQFVLLEALCGHELPVELHTAHFARGAPAASNVVKAHTDQGDRARKQGA
jgi:hypothetical protein